MKPIEEARNMITRFSYVERDADDTIPLTQVVAGFRGKAPYTDLDVYAYVEGRRRLNLTGRRDRGRRSPLFGGLTITTDADIDSRYAEWLEQDEITDSDRIKLAARIDHRLRAPHSAFPVTDGRFRLPDYFAESLETDLIPVVDTGYSIILAGPQFNPGLETRFDTLDAELMDMLNKTPSYPLE